MDSLTDQQLLREYAERQSEAAFAELVRRHLDLVYSAAVRMVCDPCLAEDVSQGAFLALAQNAQGLTGYPALAGWLHRTAQNLAAKVVRTDVRRRAREQAAAAMNESHPAEPDTVWTDIAPHLDAALRDLSEPDRDALLLRYFERKSAREMAQALGISDEAAQKRVTRAVERMRQFFVKRRVLVGSGGLLAMISANAVQGAPAGLANTLSAAAITGTTLAATSSVVTATQLVTMTALQKTLVGAALIAALGTSLYQAHQSAELRTRMQTLQQQQSNLTDQVQDVKQAQEKTQRQMAAAPAKSAVQAKSKGAAEPPPAPSPSLEQDIERAHAEPTVGRREAALEKLGRSISPIDLPRAMAFLSRKPGMDGVQSPLFRVVAHKWGEKDPNAAAAWAATLPDPALRKTATTEILYGWTHATPEAAANYAASLPAGELQDAAVMMVVKEWSFKDARGAAEWVGQFPDSKLRDEVLGPLMFWGSGACPAAMADLLDTLGKSELFEKHGENVAIVWLNRDAAAARAWIAKSPLSDEVKQRLSKRNG